MKRITIATSRTSHGISFSRRVHVNEDDLEGLLPKLGADRAAEWDNSSWRVKRSGYQEKGPIEDGATYLLLNHDDNKLRAYLNR
tara:strand:- start:453 stop:704 length:252 start_codon:yes stop_codon:yes gene_type:complete